MLIVFFVTFLVLILSFIINTKKTCKALTIAFKRLLTVLPTFVLMLILVSISLSFVSDDFIIHYLGSDNKLKTMFFAYFSGSITIMPGFIAFPLCRILITKGVPYMVVSAFTTSLMMIGVLTYPIEKTYFGAKISIIRNILYLAISVIIALITGMFYNEI